MIYLAILFSMSYFILLSAAYSGQRGTATGLLLINIIFIVCSISLVAFIDPSYLDKLNSKGLVAFGQILAIGASAKFLFHLWRTDIQNRLGIEILLIVGGVLCAIYLKTTASKLSQIGHVIVLIDSIAYAIGAFSIAGVVANLEHSFSKEQRKYPH